MCADALQIREWQASTRSEHRFRLGLVEYVGQEMRRGRVGMMVNPLERATRHDTFAEELRWDSTRWYPANFRG